MSDSWPRATPRVTRRGRGWKSTLAPPNLEIEWLTPDSADTGMRVARVCVRPFDPWEPAQSSVLQAAASVYVFEGEFEVSFGQDVHRVAAGEAINLPRGAHRMYRNGSGRPCRLLAAVLKV